MYKKIFNRCLIFILIGGLVLMPGVVPVGTVCAQVADVVDSHKESEMIVVKNDLVTLKVYSLTRLSISNPGVADIVKADADELLVIGKQPGQTAFFLWDEYGKRTVVVRVIDEDMYFIKRRMEKLMEIAGVTNIKLDVDASEGKIIATGVVMPGEKGAFQSIAGQFPNAVLDMVVAKPIEDLIQINVQISELSTTLQKSLGFDWTTEGNTSLTFAFPETMPSNPQNSFDRLLKIGDFNRTSAILATVDLLIAEGKARILSKPRIVVISGKSASFQVGGQIPVRATTSSSGGTSVQESIDFKDYGVMMDITPTLREGGKIELTLNVDITDIDAANKVENDVAFTSRAAQTELLLNDGQTIVLAGLIKQTKSVSYSKVPFLGDIPLVGMLFRKKENPSADTDTEVVISVTPTVLKENEEIKEEVKAEEVVEMNTDDMEEIEKKIDQILEASSDVEDVEEVATKEMEEVVMQEKEEEMALEEKQKAAIDEEEIAVDKEVLMEKEPELVKEGKKKKISEEVIKEEFAEEMTTKDLEVDSQKEIQKAEKVVVEEEGEQAELKIKEEAVGEMVFESEVDGEDATSIMTTYIQSIQNKIKQAISYPYEAIEKGWQGTVKLTLRILKDGTLDEAFIKESSGHDVFDKDALNTAQILAPFEAFPPMLELQEIIITLPIVYNQDAVSLNLAKLCSFTISPDRKLKPKPFISSGKPYSQIVREKIFNSLVYPKKAEEKGLEGTTKINLRILRDGTLAHASVEESSGYAIFDQCAAETARRASPYSVFPADSDLKELDITVPINYSLERK